MLFIYFPIFYTLSTQENFPFNQIFEDIFVIVTFRLLVSFSSGVGSSSIIANSIHGNEWCEPLIITLPFLQDVIVASTEKDLQFHARWA